MKYRKGFVTNSSSSSFICEVCGEIESGYDIGLSDCNMVECERGHTFCECHIVKPTKKQKIFYLTSKSKRSKTIPFDKLSEEKLDELLKEILPIDDDEKDCELDEISYNSYEYPWLYCPICNLINIPEHLKLQYLLKAINKNEEQLSKEILSQFQDIDELKNFLK